ncbi:hypothetical protein JCM8202_004734 [Rhodotorula sphaerocarpa]
MGSPEMEKREGAQYGARNDAWPPQLSPYRSRNGGALASPASLSEAVAGLGWRDDSGESSDLLVRGLDERLANPPLSPYRMLLGTMERNEGKDVLEWLLYHISLGIDHFVVYDHDSDDDTVDRLLPLVELGWVTLVPYKEESRWAQPRAFERFRDDWGQHAKWLFFFDIDEFVVQNTTALDEARKQGGDFVDWFDHRYGEYGGVAFGRISFTTNGHQTRPSEGAMAAYTVARAIDRNFRAPKIASQARFMQKGGGDIHKQEYSNGKELVDPLEFAGEDRLMETGGYPVWLNHYWSKSWEECVARIKQKAFPGSWREQMGQKFCRTEMPGTDEYAEVEHVEVTQLAAFAPSIRLAIERFERRYPRFDLSTLTVSLLESLRSSRRSPLPSSDEFPAGSVIVVDSAHSPLGVLEVSLTSSEWMFNLPVHALADGGLAFTPPPDLVTDAAELVIRRTYAASPSPLRDPVSPCSIMGHLVNQPERKQLLALQAGICRDVEPGNAYSLATATWPHPRLRNEVLFRRTIHTVGPAVQLSGLPASDSEVSAEGGWHLEPYASQAHPSADDGGVTRLYTPERCPARFDATYWAQCDIGADLSTQGVYRWTPSGTGSYRDSVLSAEEVRSCLAPAGKGELEQGAAQGLRILFVGDSVASHTYMALGCLLDQVSAASASATTTRLNVGDHVRFRSFQYEMFDLVNSSISRRDWLDLFSWSKADGAPSSGAVAEEGDLPDVVVLNVGLWATTWSRLEDYDSGLRLAARHLRSILREEGERRRAGGSGGRGRRPMRIVWRDTTAVFPREGQDPLYQVNPRVEVFNEVARRVLLGTEEDQGGAGDFLRDEEEEQDRPSFDSEEASRASRAAKRWTSHPWRWLSRRPRNAREPVSSGGIEYLPAYGMTRSRADRARDNAHLCPDVQGELAEVVLQRVCGGGVAGGSGGGR